MRICLLAIAALAACSRSDPEQEAVRIEGFDPAVVPAEEIMAAAGKGRAAPAAWGQPSARLTAVPKGTAALVKLERVAGGLDSPLALEAAPGDRTGRLFVVERGGRIRILRGGRVEPEPFLDLRKRVSRNHDERGLLGLAFHPDFARNRRF